MSIERWIARCDKLEADLWELREDLSRLSEENIRLRQKQNMADEIFSKIREYCGDSL